MNRKIQSVIGILMVMFTMQLFVLSVSAASDDTQPAEPDYTDYVRYEVSSEATYSAAISSINNSDDENHLIVITEDFTISPDFEDSIFKKNNTVIISEGNHSISLFDYTSSYRSFIVRVTGTATVSLGDVNTIHNTLTLDGCSPEDLIETDNTTIKAYSGRYAIYVDGADATVNMYDGVTITGMNSETGGDYTPIYVYSGATFNMYGGLITDNIINNSNSGNGGGIIHVKYAYFNMYGGTITNVLDARTSSSYYYGSVIRAMGSSLHIEDAVIDANVTVSETHEASSYYLSGGAIYFSDNSTSAVSDTSLTIINSTITGDDTASYGGGVYIYTAKTATQITIEDTTFENNSAYYYGGAIYIGGAGSNGTIKISDCTFTDNEGSYGGAICLYSSVAGVDSVDISDSIFTGNESYYGGAVFTMSAVPLNIDECTFDSNMGYYYGGAISYYNATNTLTITDSTFTNNYSNGGGAISVYNSDDSLETSNIYLLGTTSITGNYTEDSSTPGAVYLSYSIYSLNIEDTVIVKDNYGILRDEEDNETGLVAMDIFVEFNDSIDYTSDNTIKFYLTKDLEFDNDEYEALIGFFYPSSDTMELTEPHYDVHVYNTDNTEYGTQDGEIVQLVLNTYMFSNHEDYYLIDSSLADNPDYDGSEDDVYKELHEYPETIYYMNNGTETSYEDENRYKYYETTTILGDIFSIEGKVITSWNTQADGNGISYDIGEEATRTTAGLYLYAIWTDVYTVSYDLNGGTGVAIESAIYFEGDEVVVLNQEPTLEGYTFVGWKHSIDEEVYTSEEAFVMTPSDITLTAIWKKTIVGTDLDGGSKDEEDLIGEPKDEEDLIGEPKDEEDLDGESKDEEEIEDGDKFEIADKDVVVDDDTDGSNEENADDVKEDDADEEAIPETGDGANLTLWFGVVFASLLGMAIALVSRKRID